MSRRILGLDIGSHAVKAAELRQSLRELVLGQLRALPLGDSTPSLAAELRDFVQTFDLPREFTVASVAGDRLSTRRLSFPFSDRRKIRAAVPFEVEGQVPFELHEFFVDFEVAGEREGRTDVVAALVPKAEVALLLASLRDAQIDARVVEAEGLALANLAAFFPLGGVRLLVDLGHRKTTLCLCVDGRAVAARTVPVAGHAVTQALAGERRIGEAEAERRKVELGVLPPSREASPAATAVIDRIAREIVRTVGSLESVLPAREGPALDEVTLLGGTAHLHRVEEYLAERTGFAVRRLAPPPGELGNAIVAQGDPLLYAPALALALRGSAQARSHMNFRQDELAHRVDLGRIARELRTTGAIAALAAVLALAGVATRMGLAGRRTDAIERQSLALYEQAFPGQPAPPSVISAMQQAVGAAQDRAETLGVYRGNLSALDLLTEISARIPKDLEVEFEELSIEGQVVQIRGHSPAFGSVDRLRAELARFEPFQGITVGDITSDPKRGGQNFSMRISLQLRGGAGGEERAS
ncbi:MAG TPA: pilus assembly protein PilM [Myxococcota bacterium]|nr:pilus assembly protein PilM [Myxococcota bacterium]